MSTDLVASWLHADRASARDASEREALGGGVALRHAILELWQQGARDGDLLSAFAQLARGAATDGVSITTALGMVSSFVAQVPSAAPLVSLLCATVVDAHAQKQLELTQHEHRARFEPAWVMVSANVAAIVADPPTDDHDWLQAWADRTALAVMRAGARSCVLRCNEAASQALCFALGLVGVEVGAAPAEERRSLWQRLRR